MGHGSPPRASEGTSAGRAEDGAADSRSAWLLAGQDLLREGGYRAVKLASLSERTGLTTGSFYHHFGGMAEYLTELAAYFGSEQPRTVLTRLSELPATTRLQELERLSVELHMGALHRAMRDWATIDATAAAAVRDADHVLLEFLRDAFIDLDVDRSGAELRAEAVYALAVARLDTPWPRRSTSLRRVAGSFASGADRTGADRTGADRAATRRSGGRGSPSSAP